MTTWDWIRIVVLLFVVVWIFRRLSRPSKPTTSLSKAEPAPPVSETKGRSKYFTVGPTDAETEAHRKEHARQEAARAAIEDFSKTHAGDIVDVLRDYVNAKPELRLHVMRSDGFESGNGHRTNSRDRTWYLKSDYSVVDVYAGVSINAKVGVASIDIDVLAKGRDLSDTDALAHHLCRAAGVDRERLNRPNGGLHKRLGDINIA